MKFHHIIAVFHGIYRLSVNEIRDKPCFIGLHVNSEEKEKQQK